MIVVCNTSPLTNLAAIKQFELLSCLFREVHIANGVWDELNAEGIRWPGSDEVASAGWISRHSDG
jgi:predicted nucleic acid-binding protein